MAEDSHDHRQIAVFFTKKNASDVAVKFCSVKRGAISVMVGNLVSYIQYSAQKTQQGEDDLHVLV